MTTATHAWLERLSDYHSGALDDAARAQVEAHLRGCAECQEAVRMYQRFYELMRSPLRLGAPSHSIVEHGPPISGTPRSPVPGGPARPRTIGLVAAALAAVVVAGGFIGVLASRGLLGGPSHAATPTATTKPSGTATATGTLASATPTQVARSAFVCANPSGSALTYAYVDADRQIYAVTGCQTPVQVTHLQYPSEVGVPTPLAISPAHHYLTYYPNLPTDQCFQVVDVSTGTTLTTQHGCLFDQTPAPSELRTFVDWIDDKVYLERVDVLSGDVSDPARLVRVDARTGAETLIKSYAWMSDVRVRAGYAFFGSRINPNDTTAYLYRLSLADGTDTRLVSLGLSGFGGCQAGFGPCSWTMPWDVSPDGTHILYHNPGGDRLPTDTSSPTNTPIYYANLDGSAAVRLFASVLSGGTGAPAFDPTGTHATILHTSADGQSQELLLQPVSGGATRSVDVTGSQTAWRADGQAIVLMRFNFVGDREISTVSLYDLLTGQTTRLADNTFGYLWVP